MARPIFLTNEHKVSILRSVFQQLKNARVTGQSIKVEKKLTYTEERTCSVCYTKEAWFKTIMLLEHQAKEVGWYGVVYRDEDDETMFRVKDIIIYPQKVTGATVEAVTDKYEAWMQGLDDETYNHRRAFIHSHVYMGTSPSGKDEQVWSDKLTQIPNDEFFIFQIMNKRGEIYSRVVDFANNIIYENNDVQTLVECENMDIWDTYKNIGKLLLSSKPEELQPAIDLFLSSGVQDFLKTADEVVTEEKPNFGNTTTGNYGSGYYNGVYRGGQYYGGSYGNYQNGYNSRFYDDDEDDTPANVYALPEKTEEQVPIVETDGDELSEEDVRWLIDEYGRETVEKYGKKLLDPYFWTDGEGVDL